MHPTTSIIGNLQIPAVGQIRGPDLPVEIRQPTLHRHVSIILQVECLPLHIRRVAGKPTRPFMSWTFASCT